MSTIENDPTAGLADRIRIEREARRWSLADLAERSGVSKAMISKIERGEASPTAALLGRLSGAFGLTLSVLLARVEQRSGRLTRAGGQPVWRDPGTGYLRRQLFSGETVPLELVEVELPAGAVVSFPAASYAFLRQIIWMIEGRLVFQEGAERHELGPGDCLELGEPQDCAFHNESGATCRYLVAVVRR